MQSIESIEPPSGGVGPLRLLIVEDSATFASLVVEELKRTGRAIDFERVNTPAELRAALAKPWDAVVSDWSQPEFNGRAALDLLKELQLDVPFIVVSETLGEHSVDAIRAGAHDCVQRDKLDRLTPVVERELRERDTRHARRQAELSQRKSERRMRRMVESASVGVWFFGAEGKTSFMNQRTAQILGLTAEEAATASVTDYIDEADRPSLTERLAARKAGVTGSYEQKFRRKDGSVGWGVFESSPMFDPDGEFEGILTVMADVTEQRNSQEAQREAELRFRRIFESGITGLIIGDRFGGIAEANDAFLTMVGYSREELQAGLLNRHELTPLEWRAANAMVSEELTAHGLVRPFEKEYLHKDGTRVPVLVGFAILDEQRTLTIVTDLTARKLAEQAKVSLEEQLRQSQKMDAIGRLAGGVAHDFNNLLSVILSYSELVIADLKVGDPLRDDVEEIRRAGVRAAELTRQLLMFSRQQVVEPKVLALNEMLAGMDRMLQRLVGEDVELTRISGAALGHVRADPGSIEQVIMNLVVNARDAMPIGGKLSMETSNVVLDEEYVHTHLGSLPGSYVMLAVTDTGGGMDKATQARIFEPFFTTKDIGRGTGLGLSTVFGIVQQSGGNVWVYSELGIGTTFKIYLPRVDAAGPDEAPVVKAPTRRGTETILLVEDEEQVRDVARGILERHGYVVLVARNAGDALLFCEQHVGRIHLLLSDVVMPGMSGPALAKRLAVARPEMQVLCMSGYTDDAALRHGLVEAELAYLQKPLTVETLTRKVREVLDSRIEAIASH